MTPDEIAADDKRRGDDFVAGALRVAHRKYPGSPEDQAHELWWWLEVLQAFVDIREYTTPLLVAEIKRLEGDV